MLPEVPLLPDDGLAAAPSAAAAALAADWANSAADEKHREAPEPKRKQRQSTNWIFTVNGIPQDEQLCREMCAVLLGQLERSGRFLRLIFQLERGKDSGLLHLQGACQTQHKTSLAGLVSWKAFDPFVPHFERMLGKPEQAWAYCSKDETRVAGPFMIGDEPRAGQGTRTDIQRAHAAIKTIAVADDPVKCESMVRDEYVSVEAKYLRWFDRKVEEVMPQRSWHTMGVVLTGPPGTGKSTFARSNAIALGYEPDDVFVLENRHDVRSTLWFDGYRSQSVVILDEFKYGSVSGVEFNKLLDCFPHRVQVKGGFVPFRARVMYFISNDDFENWFESSLQQQAALRRVHLWIRFDYLPGHLPNEDFSNARDCAEHAVLETRKAVPCPR